MYHRGFVAENVTCSYFNLAEKGHLCYMTVQTCRQRLKQCSLPLSQVERSDPSRSGTKK